MRSPFAVLGVPASASLLEIKRAYARLLKVTRPDEDAAAFQKLEEAYAACVRLARQRAHVEAEAPVVVREPELETEGALPERVVDASMPRPGAPREEASIRPRRHDPLPVNGPADADDTVVPPRRSDPFPVNTPRRRPATATPTHSAAQVQALVEEIVQQAERHGPDHLRHWLANHEALLSLDLQRLVARRLPAHLMRNPPRFDTTCLQVIYEFFFGGDYLPDSQGDHDLRRLWTMVRGEEAFRQALSRLRRSATGYLDRLALAELLSAPSRKRRLLLRMLPGGIGRVVHVLRMLLQLDEHRARREIQPDSLAHWLPWLDAPGVAAGPTGAVIGAIVAMLIVVVGITCVVVDAGWGVWVGMSTAFLVIGTASWLGIIAVMTLKHSRRLRRERLIAAGKTPWDLLLVTVLLGGAASLALCGLHVAWAKEGYPGATLAICLNIVTTVQLTAIGHGKRLEVTLLVGAVMFAVWSATGLSPVFQYDPSLRVAFSWASGVVGGALADPLHAAVERIRMSESRKELNYVALVLALVVGFGTLSVGLRDAPEEVAFGPEVPVSNEVTPELRAQWQREVEQRRQEAPPDTAAGARAARLGTAGTDWNRFVEQQQMQAWEQVRTPPPKPVWTNDSVAPTRVLCEPATLLADEEAAAARGPRTIKVELLFDDYGQVQDTRLVRSSGSPLLDSAALGSGFHCRVQPGTRGGEYAGGRVKVDIRMR